MTSLSIKQLFLNFSAVLWEKIKQTIYGNLPTPHIQVTLYTHTYFCSKMAIKVTITKSISKPKNSAKMAVLHQISLQYKRILMEYTIWPLKGSKYEPRNWNWRVLDKIVQIRKICDSAPNWLKASAKKEGSYVEWSLPIIIPIYLGNKTCYQWNLNICS